MQKFDCFFFLLTPSHTRFYLLMCTWFYAIYGFILFNLRINRHLMQIVYGAMEVTLNLVLRYKHLTMLK